MVGKSSSVGSLRRLKAFFSSIRIALFVQAEVVSSVRREPDQRNVEIMHLLVDAFHLNLRVSR